ncbi:hypothetical protein [Clostridium oceanicum]|uniref:Uncharacterized protein n=1 Tax=Clostridium oceanicum TaxID=1543 RepID=A0ABN1JVE4_9CLOT
MVNNVFGTIIKGSNIVFLDIPYEDYFSKYHELDKDSASNLTTDYFTNKGKDIIPDIVDIEYDDYENKVKITAKINKSFENEGSNINYPHILNR